MALELSGKLIAKLAEQSGAGKNGTWVKQDFVIETQDQFPKKVCFSAWGDKAAMVKNIEIGQDVKVSFNPESREFNTKWYTDLRIWKLDIIGQSTGSANDNAVPLPNESQFGSLEQNEAADDLPF